MNEFLRLLLENYNLTIKDLGERSNPGSFSNLKTPYECPDFLNVIKRIKLAIERKEKAVIYGDYDVDGLTSTAILKLGLEKAGLNCGFFTPSRYLDGYGLTVEYVNKFHDKGYNLIIAVDNGISAFEAIDLAKSYSMDVIVIDHHKKEEKDVSTPYIFHQEYSNFLDYNCSAASLAFFVVSYLNSSFDNYLATLAGIAVFSDIMPLVGNNLELAKLMLENLNKYRYANFAYLLKDNRPFEYEDINFNIIPVLNSPGRLDDNIKATINACSFLIEYQDKAKIKTLGDYLLETNVNRKKYLQTISLNKDNCFESEHAIAYYVDCKSGMAGLLANKIMNSTTKSVMIFTNDERKENVLTGSIRVLKDFRCDTFLEKNKDKLLTYGGHLNASGLTIKKEKFFQIATSFISEIEKQFLEIDEVKENLIPITYEDLNEENYQELKKFQPFGEEFPAPKFQITVSTENLFMTKNKNSIFYKEENSKGKITYFGKCDNFELLKQQETITFIGNFRKDNFFNTVTYALFADKILP